MEFIRDVRCEDSVWMKVRGGRGVYLCCVYMPTEGIIVLYNKLLRESGDVIDIGISAHFLVWLEKQRIPGNN